MAVSRFLCLISYLSINLIGMHKICVIKVNHSLNINDFVIETMEVNLNCHITLIQLISLNKYISTSILRKKIEIRFSHCNINKTTASTKFVKFSILFCYPVN